MYGTILVAYDGSGAAQNALNTAVTLAKTFEADLYVAHTPQIDTPPVVVGSYIGPVDMPPTPEQFANAAKHVEAKVADMVNEIGGTLAGCHVSMDQPADHVLKTADLVGADLIVMGRRGLGPFRALALGSVSQAVASGAKCACLTVV